MIREFQCVPPSFDFTYEINTAICPYVQTTICCGVAWDKALGQALFCIP